MIVFSNPYSFLFLSVPHRLVYLKVTPRNLESLSLKDLHRLAWNFKSRHSFLWPGIWQVREVKWPQLKPLAAIEAIESLLQSSWYGWLKCLSLMEPLYYYLPGKADSCHVFAFVLRYRFSLSWRVFIHEVCVRNIPPSHKLLSSSAIQWGNRSTLATEEEKAVFVNTSRHWINQLRGGKCYQSK